MLLQVSGPVVGRITAARVDSALTRILARPEFAKAEPSALQQWLRDAAQWAWDLVAGVLRRLFPHLEMSQSAWSTLGAFLRLAGVLLGLALMAYIVVLIVRAVRRRRRLLASREGSAVADRTAEDWEAAARAAAAREDWRGAAMALYQAVLLRLSKAGALTLDRAKTPGDYRRDLGHDSALAARFETFLLGFERVAYGASRPGPDQYGRLTASAALLGSHG